jgi:hypothetical protein
MFELVQHPQWPPKRPERSGFLAISVFCITVAFGFVARDHVLVRSKPPESKNNVASDQAPETDKHSGMDVEIKRWQAITIVPAPKRALKCRCHIDSQVAGQAITHHSSQFAMCKLVTQSDQQWHRGFFDRREVLIRWHCTEQ